MSRVRRRLNEALSLDSGGDNPTGEWQGRQGAQPLVFAIGAMQDGSHRVICDVLEQQGWVRQQLESKVRDPAPPRQFTSALLTVFPPAHAWCVMCTSHH